MRSVIAPYSPARRSLLSSSESVHNEGEGYSVAGRVGAKGEPVARVMDKLTGNLSLQVGLVAISASLLGWLIFVICFGSFNNGTNL